jgi:hypothetical protein
MSAGIGTSWSTGEKVQPAPNGLWSWLSTNDHPVTTRLAPPPGLVNSHFHG